MKAFRVLAKWGVYLVVAFFAILGVAVIVLNLYKKEILASINEKLRAAVQGDVSIGDYHLSMLHRFPQLSIKLSDIYLHGPRYDQHHKPFLRAEQVYVNLAVYRLLTRDISIRSVDVENGEIFIFKAQSGYSNTEVFKSRKARGANTGRQLAVADLHQINLTNVRFTFHDSLKLKHVGVTFHRTRNDLSEDRSSASTHLHTTGNMTFQGLMLNAEKGSFLRDVNALTNLRVELDSTLTHLAIQPSRIIFDKTSLNLSGNFRLGTERRFDLSIRSDNVDHEEARKIVHDTLASKISKFQVASPIKIDVQVQGVMQSGVKPAVDVAFSLHDGNVTAGAIDARQVTLNGTFMNHLNPDVPNDDNNARLHFEKVIAVVDNVPVEATATLSDMKDPKLDLKALFDTPLRNLNTNFDSTKIKFTGGHFRSAFTYSGKLREYMDETRTEYKGKLSGQATISDGAFQYNKDLRISRVNAVFEFNEKRFDIKALNLAANKNDVSITGTVTDFIPFFIQPNGTGKVKLSIASPKIDLTGISKPRKLMSKQRSRAKLQRSKEQMVDIVDRLNESLDFDLTFNIGQFVNRNFKASRLKGQLLLAKNQFQIKDLKMNFGGGSVLLNTHIREVDNKLSPITIKANATDVGLKDFFHAFNNFNQKTFTDDKITGRLSLDINLRSAIDEKLDLQMSDLNGNATFTIQKMRLTNFEPIQRLRNFLMKGRDFSDVEFGEITSTVAMRGTKMDVSRMEVESTILTMFIEGIYDLGDSTDLAVQVPLSNLRKRDQKIAPENIGTDARVGPSVFLRVRTDKNGKTVISYDPFKKFRKKRPAADAAD